MIFDNPLVLGAILAAVGLLVWALAAVLLRLSFRRKHRPLAFHPGLAEGANGLKDPLLLVKPGGRVLWMNQAAREAFKLQPAEHPDLEGLVRKIRPAGALLEICAQDGQARLTLEGQPVEASSHFLPVDPQGVRVITFRSTDLAAGLSVEQGGLPAQTLQAFIELTQAMVASLDLEQTLFSILESIERVLPGDLCEITLLDADRTMLVPYRIAPVAGGERRLETARERYALDEGLSGYLARERQPLLIPDLEKRPEFEPALDRRKYPLRSFLGVPLLAGQEWIGTLELASFAPAAFQPQDRDLLALISGQAAVAIHNAMLFQQEQRRSAELNGLAQLAQAFSSVRDPKGVFEQLVTTIQPLVRVRILGFLIYNETARMLEGRAPFVGIPPQFMEMYRVAVPANSLLEKTFLDQDVLITENASEDSRWEEIGLQPMAIAAGLKDTVLIPLATGGRILGYLQASNHIEDGSGFSQEELHLLMIVANQAAPIIDNASLIQQARQRAQRAEGLRRIASLASSAATLDEILKFSLQELARLLHADQALAFLLDQNQVSLALHRPSRYGEFAETTERHTRLLVDDPQYHFTATGRQHTFHLGHAVEEKPVIPFYQQLIQAWKIESLVVVPLVVRDEGIGEIWLASQAAEFFDQGDLQLIATAAGQLAGVVERSFLVTQTDDSLRRRIEQMTSLTRITRELSNSLDLKYLLQLVYDEALRTTRADCGSILFFDPDQPSQDVPRVRYSVGDPPPEALSPLELQVLAGGVAYLLRDADNPDYQLPHSGVQSCLLVPILYRENPGGLIILHASDSARFDEAAMDVAQSLAAQAAIALSNAIQYEEQTRHGTLLQRQLETLSELFQVSSFLRPEQPFDRALEQIAQSIVDATPFRVVLISVYDPASNSLRRVTSRGIAAPVWEELSSRIQPWRGIQQLCQERFKIGNLYFIPADEQPLVPEDVHTVAVLPTREQVEYNAWDSDDFLLAPLLDSQGVPLGLISVDDPRDGRRPDRPALDALEIFSVQAALLIENNRYFTGLRQRLETLESDSQRLEQAASAANEQVPMLLHRQLEQTIESRQLYRQMERVRSGLEMARLVSRQPDTRAALSVMGKALLEHFGLSAALVAESGPAGPGLLEVLGSLPPGANPEALFGQRNPLRQALADGNLVLAHQLDGHKEWQNIPLLNGLDVRSFAVFPFEIAAGRRAAVMVSGQRTLPPFSGEDHQIYAQLCRQVSVSLQNLELLEQTRLRLSEVNLLLEFSRKLGSFDQASILNNLLESALQVLPSADAGWVGLLDETGDVLIPLAARGYVEPDSLYAIRYHLEHTPPPLPVRVFQAAAPARVNDIQFGEDYNLPTQDLLCYQAAAGGRLPVSALVAPLQVSQRVLGVLVLENFAQAEAFSVEHENLALSLSQQAALALENARLFLAAEQRTTQLQALTEVSATITSSLYSEALISTLLDQLQPVAPFDTATLWLRSGDLIRIAAARGFEDAESRVAITARVEDSALFQEMARTGKAISVPDVRADNRFTKLLVPEYLSWLGIPLVVKAELIGVIALEKREAGFFKDDFIQVAMTYAGQAAVALENARLYEESIRRAAELDQRSQRLALLNRFSSDLGASLDGETILRLTSEHLLTALDANRVAVVLINDRQETILGVETPASQVKLPVVLPAAPLMEQLKDSQGIFNTEDVTLEPGLAPWVEACLAVSGVHALAIVPLITGPDLLGWLLIQSQHTRRYSSPEIELARTISNQAAIALQNARRFDETTRLKVDLEQRVAERTAELSREHHHTQTMLRVTTELSASLDIQQVLNRSLDVLNEAIGVDETLILMGAGERVYHAGQHLETGGDGGSLQHSPERQIHRWVMRQRKPILIADVRQDDRWQLGENSVPAYRSALAVPLILGEESLGTLLMLQAQEDFFTAEQFDMLQGVARQIAITLNNAELFTLIRDQSENLGALLRDQQIEASRSRGILEAVADGVVVTDLNQRITLLNVSAEDILNIRADRVVGQPLEHLAAVFSGADSAWAQTIQRWSADSASLRSGASFAEQIVLENGRVVAIHLAPVIWRSDFLGTVSIFRDITHQVQVDRLKSEFVANVSHELRTPLTSIKGYVDILLMGAGGEPSEQQIHFLKIVRENTDRLSVLVNDLLDVSRIQSGKVMLEFQRLDLGELAAEVIGEYRQRASESAKAMTFTLDAPGRLPKARGDRQRTRQVLSCLVSNSLNYTPEGGQITVRIRALDPDLIQVEVCDNGIGIPPQDQDRIFDRFFRGNDPLVMATAGTGLGLALSKILVEMQDGRIGFESSGVPGQGSVFSFSLPLYPAEER